LPSTNEIIRMIYGPFLNQHDVDVISESKISIFNNNTTNIGWEDYSEATGNFRTMGEDALKYSEIVIYNYEDSTFSTYLADQFTEQGIYTRTEGRDEILSNGDVFVESPQERTYYILNKEGVLYRKQFKTSNEQMVHIPNWMSIYENIDF